MFLEQLKLFRLPSPPPEERARHLLIGGRIVDYRLKSGAKRLSMTIDERGLRIGAPKRISLAEIEAFVQSHGGWVLKKLGELAHATQPRHLTIKDGVRLPLLDGDAEVRVLPGANRVRWIANVLVLEALRTPGTRPRRPGRRSWPLRACRASAALSRPSHSKRVRPLRSGSSRISSGDMKPMWQMWAMHWRSGSESSRPWWRISSR
jgi:hypothetical protein